MRRTLALLLLTVAACRDSAAKVDPALVSAWEMSVPNPQGTARWVLDIRANGTYDFHAEGPGNVPSHRGAFTGTNGLWTMKSANTDWSDSGTYSLPNPDAFVTTGKLGRGLWTRVAKGATPAKREHATNTPTGGIVPALMASPIAATELPSGAQPIQLTSITVDSVDARDGIAALVQGAARGTRYPGTVTYLLMRDQAARDALYEAWAVIDARTFRQQRGELASSYTTHFGPNGDGACISRVLETARTATARCYLRMTRAPRDPMIIMSSVEERRVSDAGEVSRAAMEAASALLAAAVDHWERAGGASERNR